MFLLNLKGDTYSYNLRALPEPPTRLRNVMDAEFVVLNKDVSSSKRYASYVDDSSLPVATGKSYDLQYSSKFDFVRKDFSQDFVPDTFGYVSNVGVLSELEVGRRTFVPVTTIYGETSYIPKKGFLAEKGVMIDYTSTEHPYLDYNQKSLINTAGDVKFVDVFASHESGISPYVKGKVYNIPMGEPIVGDNFIIYREYTPRFPIKQGVVVVEGVERTGEGIERFNLREGLVPEYKPIVSVKDVSSQSSLYDFGWGSGMVEYSPKYLRPRLGYYPEQSKFGYEVVSKPIDSNIKYLEDVKISKLQSRLKDVNDVADNKIILEEFPKYVEDVPIAGIGLGFVERRSKISFVGSKYANDKPSMNDFKVSDASFDDIAGVGVKPSNVVSDKVFGSNARVFSVDVDFGRKVLPSRSFVPTFVKGNLPKDIQATNLDVGTKSLFGLDTKSISVLDKGLDTRVSSGLKYDLDVGLKQRSDLTTEQVVVTEQSIVSLTEQVLVPRTSTVNRTTDIIKTKEDLDIPRVFEPPNSKSVPLFKGRKRDNSRLFRLDVKRRGRFEVVAVGEDLGDLSSRGVNILKGSARASFRVRDSGGSVVDLDLPQGFVRSKRDKGVIVQPREKRISSLGEKEEITYKGLSMRRLRR